MHRVYLPVTAVLLFAGLGLLAWAEEKKPDTKTPDEKTAAKFKGASERADQMVAAYTLVHYARKEKRNLGEDQAAATLLVAAQMLANVSAEQASLKSEDGKTELTNEPITPASLIDEAQKLSDAPYIAALAKSTRKLIEEKRGRDPYPITGSTTLKGAGIWEHDFVNGQPAVMYAFCPGGDILSIKVIDSTIPGSPPVAVKNGSSIRLEWLPEGDTRTHSYKMIVTPLSPPGFKVSWGTN